MTITRQQIDDLRALEAKAFRGPWSYTRFEIELDHGEDCEYGDEPVDCVEVQAPQEYPDGQCVCQQNVILVPGLECFAEPNGKFIAAARNALPGLLDEIERLRDVLHTATRCECGIDDVCRYVVERDAARNENAHLRDEITELQQQLFCRGDK